MKTTFKDFAFNEMKENYYQEAIYFADFVELWDDMDTEHQLEVAERFGDWSALNETK